MCGTDSRALEAAVHIIALYNRDPDPSLLKAFGLVVERMQPAARPLA